LFPRWGNYIIFSMEIPSSFIPRLDFIGEVSHCAMNDNKINEIERSPGLFTPPHAPSQFPPENSRFRGAKRAARGETWKIGK